MKMSPLFLLLLPFFAGLSPAAAQEEPAAVAAAAEPDMLRDARCGQVLVLIRMNGTPLRMMLDTGATHTVLAPETLAKIPNAQKVDTSGMQFNSSSSHQRPQLYVVETQAGPRTFAEHPVLVLPLGGVKQMLQTPIDGILGMDVLRFLPFTLDFRSGGSSHWGEPQDGALPMPLNARPDAGFSPMLTIRVGEKEISNVLLDSGSSATMFEEADWEAGTERTVTVHTADINGGAEQGMSIGKPAVIRLAEGAEQTVTPQLRGGKRADARGILGVDALRGFRLIYSPQKGFYLMK